MSATVNANVLVYGSNGDDPAHTAARGLIERLARARTTRHGLLPEPLTPRTAVDNITDLLDLPHVRTPGEADGFWILYRPTAGDQVRGNQVPDAHIATLMRQHGVRVIYTRDREFRRFDGIEPRDPFG